MDIDAFKVTNLVSSVWLKSVGSVLEMWENAEVGDASLPVPLMYNYEQMKCEQEMTKWKRFFK